MEIQNSYFRISRTSVSINHRRSSMGQVVRLLCRTATPIRCCSEITGIPSSMPLCRTVGSYGLFYDRPFDNLWLNLRFNDAVPAATGLGAPGLNYLDQSLTALIGTRNVSPALQRYPLALYQPGIRTPYVQSVFFGLQQR